jgi:hypothetical protein
MTATATALQVLTWAAEPVGQIPAGPLWDVAALRSPPGRVRDAAGQLARQTAARLGAGVPPFAEPLPGQPKSGQPKSGQPSIGLGAVFLAVAVGGRRQASAAALLAGAVPPPAPRRNPGAWYDLIARHGVAGVAVTALAEAGASAEITTSPPEAGQATAPETPQEPLLELLLAASPLTAVLYRPPLRALRSDTTGQVVATAVALLSQQRGREVLALGLASWTPHPHVLGWRASLLSRLRVRHPELVLDVFVTARTRFAADWDQKVSWAARQIAGFGEVDPLAVDTLRFWSPLAAMERDASSTRLRPLMSGQDRAVKYVRRFRLDKAGAT